MKNKLKNSIREGGRVLLLLVLMLVGATQAKAQAYYGLKINEVDVTSENCNDLSVIDGVSGTVKYVPETKTLFLENATIAAKGNFHSIYNDTIEGLIINITGENRVTAENAAILLNYNSTIIKGGGILNIENNGAGIYFLNSLVIDSCTVNVTGVWGIAGNVGEEETLTIRNANVTATGTDGSICDILSLTLDGCKIYTPEGAAFDETLHAVALNGETVTDRVVITNDTTAIEKVVNYGLRIAGINVTDKNYNDLSEISGVSGTVKYNPDTKTLTLDNATITPAGGVYGIANDSIEGLTINVIGENRLTTSPAAIYSANTSTTIKGEGGTLNIKSNSAGIYFEKSLVIDSCTVNINGAYGIGGKDGTSENLTISNAYVMATGSSGSICDIASLTLDGCKIIAPVDATFDETKHAVTLNNYLINIAVIIAPDYMKCYNLQINSVEVTDRNCNDLSVIEGVSGTVKYDPDTKTLTLENATIDDNGSRSIYSETDSLIINVIGENKLTNSGAAIGLNYTPTIIKGEGGTLNIEAGNSGIYFKKSLEIDSCTVNVKGRYGITGNNGTSETLTIRNATVTAEGKLGSICDIKSLTLEGSVISTPEGATFDETVHAVVLDGNKVTSQVVITPDATVGIKDVKENVSAREQGIYSIDGVYLGTDFDSLPKGIYIKDGKKVKK